MGLIWFLSSQEDVGPDLGGWALYATSLVHFGEFALLFVLWRWALGRTLPAAAIAIAWGALDEIHQTWVPGRDATPVDFAIDVAGIVLAAWLVARLSARARERSAARPTASRAR